MEVRFFATQAEAREWLEENHDKASELWVGFYKKGSGKTAATYAQVLDEALCFGWIDGIRKSVDETSYTNRFTPRRARSIWSAMNIKRARELFEMGAMAPAGLKAFNERDEERTMLYSFERENVSLGEEYEQRFRDNKEAWAFFQAQSPSYRKTASWWVMSAKQEETRSRRLTTLIEGSEQGKRLAQVVGKANAT